MGSTNVVGGEDELQLKEHVTKVLMQEGVLASLKAQLRAAVFRVMSEYESPEEGKSKTKELARFEEHGEAALELVFDFLRYFGWEYTAGVMSEESGVNNFKHDVEDVAHRLGLGARSADVPLLIQLLQQRSSKPSFHDAKGHARELNDNQSSTEMHEVKYSEVSNASYHSSRKEVAVEQLPDALEVVLASDRVASSESVSKAREDTKGEEEEESAEIESGSELAESIEEESVQYESEGSEHPYQQYDETIATKDAVEATTTEPDTDNYLKDLEKEVGQSALETTEEDMFMAPPPIPSALPSLSPLKMLSQHDEGVQESKYDPLDSLLDSDEAGNMEADLEEEKVDETEEVLSDGVDQDHEEDIGEMEVDETEVLSDGVDQENEEDVEAQLNMLDAKLRAMEEEDTTGTLQKLKASLEVSNDSETKLSGLNEEREDERTDRKEWQTAGVMDADDDESKRRDSKIESTSIRVQSDKESDDADAYGSDFEEEEEIASEVSEEEIEAMAESLEDQNTEQEEEEELSKLQPMPAREGRVDALEGYDYVESVERV